MIRFNGQYPFTWSYGDLCIILLKWKGQQIVMKRPIDGDSLFFFFYKLWYNIPVHIDMERRYVTWICEKCIYAIFKSQQNSGYFNAGSSKLLARVTHWCLMTGEGTGKLLLTGFLSFFFHSISFRFWKKWLVKLLTKRIQAWNIKTW